MAGTKLCLHHYAEITKNETNYEEYTMKPEKGDKCVLCDSQAVRWIVAEVFPRTPMRVIEEETPKARYVLINGDYVIGFVYIESKHGRTIVLRQDLDLDSPLLVYDRETQKNVDSIDFVTFLRDRLPTS